MKLDLQSQEGHNVHSQNHVTCRSRHFAIAYVAGQFSSKEIVTEIEIDASRSKVWAVFGNLAGHSTWNPMIPSIDGDLKVGQTLDVTIQLPGQSPMAIRPEVLVATENEELRWRGKMGVRGIFDGEHYFVLEETDTGTTLLRHGEVFSGMLVYPIMALIEDNTLEGFQALNTALKATVEAKSR